MERTTFAILLALASAVPPLSAQEPTTPIGPAVVAVVDIVRVSDESRIGQQKAQELSQLQQSLEADLEVKRTRIEADQAAFQQRVTTLEAEREQLSEEEIQQRESELMEERQTLGELFEAAQVDAQAAQRRLQNESSRLMEELNEEILPHLGAVAEELGVDILLPLSQTLLAPTELDITDRVIERLDSVYTAQNSPSNGLAGSSR